MNFLPPTSSHLLACLILLIVMMIGLGFQAFAQTWSLTDFLNNAVSILILSTGWGIIIVEVKMFVERIIEERRKKIQQEEREKIFASIEKIVRQRPLTKADIQNLQEVAEGA